MAKTALIMKSQRKPNSRPAPTTGASSAAPARLSPEVRDVSSVLPRAGAQGRGARHREGELV